MSRFRSLALVVPLFALAPGCASKDKKDTNTPAAEKTNQPDAVAVDKSRCQPNGKKVVELDVNGDKKPDVWKFYVKTVENGTQVDALACKEVDLNYDGKVDAWYYYDASSNVSHEEFDLDFDGHIDLQTFRQQGKIVREELDTNFDGKPDVWKFYENEKLVRVERSNKANGKVDVWEYYEGGKLDRIGYDTTGSGRVDRWERAPDETPDKDKEQTVAQPAANTTPTAPKPPQAAPRAVSPEPSGK
jgi:hypothetical protein